jgi:hypothetical protein
VEKRKLDLFYVGCEGKTECMYFEKLQKIYNLKIIIEKVGNHKLDKILNKGRSLKKKNKNKGIYFACFDVEHERATNDDGYKNIITKIHNKDNDKCNIFNYYLVTNRQFEQWLQWHWDDTTYNPKNEFDETIKNNLENKIKELTENHITKAIDKAKTFNNDCNRDLAFSTCHLMTKMFKI